MWTLQHTTSPKREFERSIGMFSEVTIKEAVVRMMKRKERGINELVATRRKLGKRWSKAEKLEKESLNIIWDDTRQVLAGLQVVL